MVVLAFEYLYAILVCRDDVADDDGPQDITVRATDRASADIGEVVQRPVPADDLQIGPGDGNRAENLVTRDRVSHDGGAQTKLDLPTASRERRSDIDCGFGLLIGSPVAGEHRRWICIFAGKVYAGDET